MTATSSLTVTLDRTKFLRDATDQLLRRDLLVGIPGDGPPRVGSDGKAEPSNAIIGYVQEAGEPDKNIPARPFLLPGVTAAQPAIVKGMEAAGKAAMDGKVDGIDAGFTRAGLAAQTAVRNQILTGTFAPLSERTLEARARRTTSSGKLSQAETSKAARKELADRRAGALATTNAKPLYDTHSLFNSVTFITRDKKAT